MALSQTIAVIAVAAACTFFTRLVPFILFGGKKEIPKSVRYIGGVLPPAVIASLIIYCLKDVDVTKFPSGFAELVSIGIVAALHAWKHNTLLSMAAGTVCYMILIRVF